MQELSLLDCAEVEQLMSTGVSNDGAEVASSTLTMQLVEKMKDPTIGEEESLRLYARRAMHCRALTIIHTLTSR